MSAADAPFIRRRPKDDGPLNFWSLRAEGLAAVQALSGERWTDYNLHDPGVTILEQLCYALTGLVYRADFPVADHLATPDGDLDFAALALHPADVAFPCRPTTARDYRQLLLDHLERAIDASVEPAGSDEGAPRGVWRAQLRLPHGAHDDGTQVEREALRLLRANRNLGEDFEAEAARVEPRWCELQAEIEIGGPRDAADVLAEVYLFCERWIEAAEPLAGLLSLRAQGATLEEAFDRPPVQRGVAQGSSARGQRLFVADLMAGLEAVEGVQGVRSLALVVQGHAHRDSVQRQGAGWALRLRVPDTGPQAAEQIVLTRRGTTVQPDALRVHTRYLDLLAAERSNQAAPPGGFMGPRPRGVHRTLGPHPALQDLFPAVYGINHFGLEPGARRHDQAMAWQLKGYLALFDQVLAHAGEQLAHVRELFTVGDGARQTYWWRMLGEASIPGITHELYTDDAQRIERAVYHGHDDYEDRKGRLVDYLLSLHGESHPQSTLRQFPGPYSPAELESMLFQSKLAMLRDIVRFSRDRAAAFDDSRPAWDEPGNESGLQRRVGLLLAFRHTHTRSLVEALQRKGLEPSASARGEHRERPEHWQRLALPPVPATALPRLGAFAERQVSEAALRAGASADRYGIVPRAGGGVQLFLGPDEHGGYWRLGHFDDEAAAAREAAQLRAGLLRIDQEAEGLFVVEHLLLRPIGESAAHQQLREQGVLDDSDLDLRLSVVLPAWPMRCREPNFRELAAETVLLNTPAHLQSHCLWLEYGAMRDFERRLRHWLKARAAWCADPHARALRLAMNHAACELLRVLLAARGEGGR